MDKNRASTIRKRGIALMFTAVSLVFIVPMVGLAVDAGILYTVKGKLQTAVDAAALSAASALSRGDTDQEQQAAAISEAMAFTNLNFPSGYFGVSTPYFGPGNDWVSINESVANERIVTVTASVNAPLYFLRWLNASTTTVTASATAVRRDTNVVFVMDRSGSLAVSGSCAPLKLDAISFVDKFANGTDNVGLVTFATSSNNDFVTATNFQTASPSVPTILNSVNCTGGTNTAEGLTLGYQQLVSLNEPNALNVILLFTDGYPNTFTGTFNILSSSTCNSKTPKTGVLAATYVSPNFTSPVGQDGLFNPQAGTQPMSSDLNLISNDTGCYFASNYSNVSQDIQYIPTSDYYGNQINTGYQPLDYSGSNIKVDPTSTQNAGYNAADSASLTIRQSSTIPNIRVYTIGLGNAGGVSADFLERVANDPRASNYNSSYPTGEYYYAATAADLADAFNTIASEILHLSN
ncbi:MAG TPA: VWA domain-containing protein [Bryobacteraceae bacterium]|nr:VWA domain-containing protein [Bryobacteraceae bacterium]